MRTCSSLQEVIFSNTNMTINKFSKGLPIPLMFKSVSPADPEAVSNADFSPVQEKGKFYSVSIQKVFLGSMSYNSQFPHSLLMSFGAVTVSALPYWLPNLPPAATTAE